MRFVLSALTLFAVAGCQYVDPWNRGERPATRAMPGPDAAGAQQRFEDPGIRNQPRPLTPR